MSEHDENAIAELAYAESLIAALAEPFTPEQTSTRKGGGGREFTYIDGTAVISRLNEVTTGRWSSRLVGQPMVRDLDTSRGTVPCLMAFVELRIDELGTHVGMGVQMIEPNAGEDVMKGVITDGMKNAAKYFGVGLYLYPGAAGYGSVASGGGGGYTPGGSGSFGPQSASWNDPASEGQVKFVRSLVRDLNMTPAEARTAIGVDRAEEMTKGQASQAIETLKGMSGDGGGR